jgi:hypothetical protein
LNGGIRVSAEHGSLESQEDTGQDAQAKVTIQQQEPFRRKFFEEVEERFVFAFELGEPVIRIQPIFVHAQQVRGANGVEARRERLLHPGTQGQEPRQFQRPQLLAPEAQAGGVPRLFGGGPQGIG